MNILSQLILLHQNGYKALAATDGSDDSQRAARELRNKIVRVGKGDLNSLAFLSSIANPNPKPMKWTSAGNGEILG